MLLRHIAVLMVAIAFTPMVRAQHSGHPAVPVSISVVDTLGTAVGNACVTITRHAQNLQFTEDTDANGKLAVTLSAGSYDFTVTAPAFEKTVQHLEVASNSPASLKIRLPVGSCSGGCGPEVTSAAPLRGADAAQVRKSPPGKKPGACPVPISIRVVDLSKAPVTGALINIEDLRQDLKSSQETNFSGTLPVVLAPGDYEIKVAASGFGNTTTPLEITRESPPCVQIELPYYVCSNCVEIGSTTSHDTDAVKRVIYTQCGSDRK